MQDPTSAHVQGLLGRPPGWPNPTPEQERRHLRLAESVLRRRLAEHEATAVCDPWTGQPCPFVIREGAALVAVLTDLRELDREAEGEGGGSHNEAKGEE
jgi:hypothetical protein